MIKNIIEIDNWWKIIIAGALFAILAQMIYSSVSFLTMDYYTNPDYFALWSKLMMPNQGPPGMSFFIISMLFNLIAGIIYAVLYTFVKRLLQFSTVKNGIIFGTILFIGGSIPGYLSMFLLLSIPSGLLIFWVLEGLIISILGGILIAKVEDY